jgi:hypothetical protein
MLGTYAYRMSTEKGKTCSTIYRSQRPASLLRASRVPLVGAKAYGKKKISRPEHDEPQKRTFPNDYMAKNAPKRVKKVMSLAWIEQATARRRIDKLQSCALPTELK